jgi:hypothetical protein
MTKTILTLAAALALITTPDTANAEDPPALFDKDGNYDMQVACPLWQWVPEGETPPTKTPRGC